MKYTFFLLSFVILSSCSTQKVLKTDSQDDIDLSGRWNDTDAEIATNELYNNLLASTWLKNHKAQFDLIPRVEIDSFESNFKGGGESLEKFFSKYIHDDPSLNLIEKGDRKSAEFQVTGAITAEEFINADQNYIDYVLQVQLKDLNGITLWEDTTTIKKYIKN
ncbi:hypothetical protein [Marivirga harenae]|uniref:hypothetical protein n=1 Tax=Marivirga harenae TaxID=2010992 RepID=UPI0026E0D8FB|nr:hypothetical protein [Marivirga harenae]WKV11552.1 hypothetical protein Q3Y49_15215 [Marivirga harenae]